MLSEYPLRMRVRTSGVIYLHSSSPLEKEKKRKGHRCQAIVVVSHVFKPKVLQWVVGILTAVVSILQNRLY